MELTANGRLSKTLTYSTSGTLMWNEIDPRIDGVSQARSGTTGSVRSTLNWQATPRDYLQLNAIYGGKQLLPQGYRKTSAVLNLGYRHKVNDRLNLLLTAQDLFDTAKAELVVKTPTLRDRIRQTGMGRVLLFGLSYNFGGQSQRQRDQGFDFQQPSADGPQ